LTMQLQTIRSRIIFFHNDRLD